MKQRGAVTRVCPVQGGRRLSRKSTGAERVARAMDGEETQGVARQRLPPPTR